MEINETKGMNDNLPRFSLIQKTLCAKDKWITQSFNVRKCSFLYDNKKKKRGRGILITQKDVQVRRSCCQGEACLETY